MTAREGRAVGNPGTRLPLIGFSEKKKQTINNKRVSEWSNQVRTRAGERVACERVFPWKSVLQ